MFEISSSPVRAVIVTPQVMSVPAFVMKIFEPFTTQEPSRSSAVVRVAPASEPASGLGQPERGEPPARGEVREPALLLLVGAEEEDRHRPERGVRGDGDRDGGVDPRQLLDRDRIARPCRRRRRRTPRGWEPHQPELAELGDELVREAALAVELLGDGRDALPRERADGVADELLLGGEVEVHGARIVPRGRLRPFANEEEEVETMGSVQEFFDGLPAA